jgi:hypothetical protein
MTRADVFTAVCLVVAIVLTLLAVFTGQAQADGGELAYTTSAEANPDSLGLVTHTGTYQVWLEPGCQSVWPGAEVLLEGDPALPTLRVVDPLLGVQAEPCQVVRAVWRSDRACATNPDGQCDVAYLR